MDRDVEDWQGLSYSCGGDGVSDKYNGLEMDLSQWPDNCPYCYRELDNEHYNDACMKPSCPSGSTEIHRCFTCGLERITYEGQAKEHKCKCVEVTA